MTQRKGQRKAPKPKSSMFPLMHDNVSSLLEDDGVHFTFHNLDEDDGSIKTYDTNIMGRFHCRNQKCQANGWSSMRIAITIRMYQDNQYNVRVYHQRCMKCNIPSKPILDDSYADRVAYRLKKWRGIEQERPQFSRKSKGPHVESLCEGCRAGHCTQTSSIDYLVRGLSNFTLGVA